MVHWAAPFESANNSVTSVSNAFATFPIVLGDTSFFPHRDNIYGVTELFLITLFCPYMPVPMQYSAFPLILSKCSPFNLLFLFVFRYVTTLYILLYYCQLLFEFIFLFFVLSYLLLSLHVV